MPPKSECSCSAAAAAAAHRATCARRGAHTPLSSLKQSNVPRLPPTRPIRRLCALLHRSHPAGFANASELHDMLLVSL